MTRHETRDLRPVGTNRPVGTARSVDPRMTFPRVLRAEALRLRRSPLVLLHLVCALVSGPVCGAYFAYAPWDTALGADAFVQLLGALMPLMAGIVCGLDADGEDEATGLSALLSVPSRRIALAGRLCALWLMGAVTLALAIGSFAGVLTLAGQNPFGLVVWVRAIAGISFGSVPVYLLLYALALRWGRNATIAAGAAGLMLAFFSVGGLAHNLMTGKLTAIGTNAFTFLPTSWPIRLGSLPIEFAVAAGVANVTGGPAGTETELWSALGLCAVVTTLLSGAAALWIARFEPVRREG